MSLILQIETATSCCSAALAKDGSILASREINERNIHAEVITKFIEEVAAVVGIRLTDLDAVAVSCGPGSYTGLRIGVSVAKGLCFALDIPLIAVGTLEAMAYGVISLAKQKPDDQTLLCPMIDARRMEVFTAIFNTAGELVKPTAAEIINENSFAGLLVNNKILFFGDGAEKCRSVLSGNANADFLTGFINSAAYLTQTALKKFEENKFEDVGYFEPFYLKDFIAGKKN